jgi:hypothetical protein
MIQRLSVAAVVFATLFARHSIAANTIYESQLISPTAPNAWVGGFGFDGSTLLVATQLDSYYATKQVRVFQRDAQNHFAEQPPITSGPPDPQRFGGSLAVSGDFMLMGAPGFSLGNNLDEGIASVFQRTGQSWSPIGQYFGSKTYDYMGEAVDINGQRLIMGAPGQSGHGVAYIASTDTDWNGNWTITPLSGSGSQYLNFGASVAIEGDTAVVGAPAGDYLNVPAAFVFHRNASGSWSQTARLTGDSAYGSFGAAVDIHDDLMIIGDPYDVSGGFATGAAYVYRRVGATNWVRQAKLTSGDRPSNEHFGAAVSIGDDDSLLIGLPEFTNDSGWIGAAALFTPDAPNSWNETAFLLPSIQTSSGHFGRQVALHNHIAVVSAATEFGYLGPIGAEFIYANVPEPAVLQLIAIAFCAIAAALRRRGRAGTHLGFLSRANVA